MCFHIMSSFIYLMLTIFSRAHAKMKYIQQSQRNYVHITKYKQQRGLCYQLVCTGNIWLHESALSAFYSYIIHVVRQTLKLEMGSLKLGSHVQFPTELSKSLKQLRQFSVFIFYRETESERDHSTVSFNAVGARLKPGQYRWQSSAFSE